MTSLSADNTPVEQTLELVVHDLAGLREMRARLDEVMHESQIDAETATDVQIATSELVTNGLLHGAAESVGVRAQIRRDRIEMRVDHADAAGPTPRRQLPPTDHESGRGLSIVDAIGDVVDVAREQGRRATEVTFVRNGGPVGPASAAAN